MARKSKATIKAEERERERVRVEWNERFSPENVAKLRSEMLANADPERRKQLEELAEHAKQPRESAQAEFVRVFGKVDTAERHNALSRYLWEFAGQYANGQISDMADFMREQRKKGPRSGGNKAAKRKQDDARSSWHDAALKHRKRLLENGTASHEVIGKIAGKFNKSSSAVRRLFNKNPRA